MRAEEKLRDLGMEQAEIDRIKSSRRPPSGLVIRSPVSGHIINKPIVEGASVAGRRHAVRRGRSVARLDRGRTSTRPICRCCAGGQNVEATVEGLPNRVFRGQIVLVHPHLETDTRTNRIRIDLPNPNHELRPGMYATVNVQVPFDQIEPFKSELTAEAAGPSATDDKSLIAFQKTCPVTGSSLAAWARR